MLLSYSNAYEPHKLGAHGMYTSGGTYLEKAQVALADGAPGSSVENFRDAGL